MPKNIRHGNPLTAAMEDYLEAIYHIVQRYGYARSGQISKRLGVHKSTVTTALHHLQVQGYIEYEPYQEVRITPKGELEAKGIVRRHDIFFRLLHNLLEIEKDEASKLACELEHALPPEVVDRFVQLVEKALKNKNAIATTNAKIQKYKIKKNKLKTEKNTETIQN
ncbi:MAG: metal-dependent transcriptional regulator [Planctomycetaceae bacterium]|jgi:DtxR family Mn-dependent transcriptional regulator|nr:metal-dependent transcriptional regulator [Planctomycetaceae bacterium]